MPIDPVLAVVGEQASKETYEQTYIDMGLDKPVIVQFYYYLSDVLQGNFGASLLTARPVLDDLLRVFPATLELSTIAIAIGVLLGVPLGIVSAIKPGTWIDVTVRIIALMGYSAPIFWLGMIGLLVFYGELGWVGGPGRLDIVYMDTIPNVTGAILVDSLLARDTATFKNALAHIILPASVLGYYSLAYICRMTRSFMLNELNSEYVLTARAKGVRETTIIRRHVFRNIRVPLVTVIALSYGNLLEGAVLTEFVFSWPGIGSYITTALLSADMNAVLGGTFLVGAVFILLNLSSDFLYRYLDPRTR